MKNFKKPKMSTVVRIAVVIAFLILSALSVISENRNLIKLVGCFGPVLIVIAFYDKIW